MLKQLLFSNPVFHDGINVTVRRGYKWADAMGEVVDVVNTDGTGKPIMAQILGVLTTKLNTIPESILQHEHDPTCRTLHGIAKEMRNVYGDDVKDDEPVTVLFLEFGKSAIFEVEDCRWPTIVMTGQHHGWLGGTRRLLRRHHSRRMTLGPRPSALGYRLSVTSPFPDQSTIGDHVDHHHRDAESELQSARESCRIDDGYHVVLDEPTGVSGVTRCVS